MGVLDKAKKLNKEFKNDNLSVMADVVPHYTRLTTNALGFDYPLGGGLPFGRVVTFAGVEHSGKTLAAALQIAAYQRERPDKVCVYIDVEHSLDIEFVCSMTGLDATKMLYVNPERLSGEDIFSYIYELQGEDDIGMVVLDSIPALISSRDYDSDIGDDKGMAAGIAKPLSKFIKRMVDEVSIKKNILILINQVREAGKTFTGATIYTEPGGHAPRFYSSVKIRFGTRKFMKGDDELKSGDGEDADGFRLVYKVTKNKTFNTKRGGGFVTFRYDTGLDWKHDLIEIATKFNFIQRPNNQTYVLVDLNSGEVLTGSDGKELKFRGKQSMLDFLEENVDFQVKYLNMIQEFIAAADSNYGSLLDARAEAEISAQENSVEGHNAQTEEQYERELELLKKAKEESEED